MIFQLTHRYSENSSRKGDLNDIRSWIKSFAPSNANPQNLRFIESNVTRADITHSGLIYYLHACWAKELGCVLRPDMIYFTILSEIANCVIRRPKDFKSLFTDKNGKEDIIIVDHNADNGGLNIQTLCQAMHEKIANKELYRLVCDIQFASDDFGAYDARCMAFCKMGIPFFNYMTTLCGISSVDIQGQFDDWKMLLNTLNQLRNLLSMYDSSGNVNTLLGKSIATVSTIIHFTFDTNFQTDAKYPTAQLFFNDIFHYGSNRQCGSGHDQYIVSGWARNFYNSQGEDLTNFSTSMTYVPYKNIETGRMFIQVSTLACSDIVNDVATPHYGKLKFEILDEGLFNKISMKNDNDKSMFTFDF